MALSSYEQGLKQEVLEFAGDDPAQLKEGLLKALNHHHEFERGRRGYLYRVVGGAAWAAIVAARRRANCPVDNGKKYYLP